MSERSFPFDGGEGAILSEADWSAMASAWQDDGVADAPTGTALKVESEGVAGKLVVRAGRANFKGFHYVLDADLDLSYTPNTHTTLERPDLVVLRLDWGTNKVYVAIKEGVPGGVTPTPDTSGQTPEMPLASYTAPVNAGPVSPVGVTDLRTFMGTRIRMSASGDEWFPAGTVWYNAAIGDFEKCIRRPGSSFDEVLPLAPTLPFHETRYRSSIIEVPGGGGLVFDNQLSVDVGVGIWLFELCLIYELDQDYQPFIGGLEFPNLAAGDQIRSFSESPVPNTQASDAPRYGQFGGVSGVYEDPQVGEWFYGTFKFFPQVAYMRGTLRNTNSTQGGLIRAYYESPTGYPTARIWDGSWLSVREIRQN